MDVRQFCMDNMDKFNPIGKIECEGGINWNWYNFENAKDLFSIMDIIHCNYERREAEKAAENNEPVHVRFHKFNENQGSLIDDFLYYYLHKNKFELQDGEWVYKKITRY